MEAHLLKGMPGKNASGALTLGINSVILRRKGSEALSKTEGSPRVNVPSNKVERRKHYPPSVWLPSSQQDIKYSISTPSPLLGGGGVKLYSIKALYG